MQIKNLGAIVATVAAVAFASSAAAAPITGTPVGGSNFSPASTNALNYATAQSGTARPYVLLSMADVDSITLDFFNYANGLAFFEYRIDGVYAGSGNNHPIIQGDLIHSGVAVGAGNPNERTREFSATQFVDVRLALGGERDYDFDWTRFDVAAANNAVPEPGSLALAGLALLGVAAARRRRA